MDKIEKKKKENPPQRVVENNGKYKGLGKGLSGTRKVLKNCWLLILG